jgi:hypothetical protein
LAGVAPRGGAGEGENAGAKALETKSRGEGGDFFIYEGGQLLEKKDFEGGLLGESGEVDRRCGGNKFEVASDGRAADSCEGAAEDEFEGFPFDSWVLEVVAKVVKYGPCHIRGEWPCLVTRPKGGFFD